MLHRTLQRFLMEGPKSRIPSARLPTPVPRDNDSVWFHAECLPGLYQPVPPTAPFSNCHSLFHSRIVVAAPVHLGEKCLRVPFFVVTGSPNTYLHHFAVSKSKFKLEKMLQS